MQTFQWKIPESCGLVLCLACCASHASSTDGLPRLRLSAALETHPGTNPPLNSPPSTAPATPPLRLAQSSNLYARPEPVQASVLFLTVRINGLELPDVYRILQTAGGGLLVNLEDYRRWRLLPPTATTQRQDEKYVALTGINGLTYSLETARQELLLQAAPALFEAERIVLAPVRSATPLLPGWGGFLNYDTLAQRTEHVDTLNAIAELGLFSPWGVATSTHVSQDLNQKRQALRLETTFVSDFPHQRSSLRLGDALTRPGVTGSSVRFGGLQWGTNFATQPGFIPHPLPELRGEATVPSTVDIFINNALGTRGQVQPGPFEITRLPVVTGQGEVRLVQRDFLGREVVSVVPYYVSPQLLQQGLNDFSYQAGFIRENFGLSSNDYGRTFFSGVHRYGLSNRLTGEARAELLTDQQTLGIGGSFLYREIGTLSAAVAASHSPGGTGQLTVLQLERQARHMSMSARFQSASDIYTQLGSTQIFMVPRKLQNVNFGYSPGLGSYGISYTDQERRDNLSTRILTMSYSLPLPGGFFLSLSALQINDSGAKNHGLGITLVKAIGERTTVAANSTRQAGRDDSIVQVQQNLPAGSGLAFRALAGSGTTQRREAGMTLQTSTGTYGLDAGSAAGNDSIRLNASGGIATMDGRLVFSRRLEESFAMVNVPNHGNINIYQSNQPIARTDESGNVLLPRLLPYQENRIRIDARELPMDTEIDTLEQIAVPYFRSGVSVRFPVRQGNGALLILTDESGEPVPEGAKVIIQGKTDTFFAARRGEVYVTGLTDGDFVNVSWQQRACVAQTMIGPNAGPVPRIGPLKCMAVQP